MYTVCYNPVKRFTYSLYYNIILLLYNYFVFFFLSLFYFYVKDTRVKMPVIRLMDVISTIIFLRVIMHVL